MWVLLIIRMEKLNFYLFLDALERCFSAKLSYCSHEKQCRLFVRLSREKAMVHPKAKSNNSLFVVSPRQMVAIATLAKITGVLLCH